MSYFEWNNIIAKHFFNKKMAGREVFLAVDDDLIKLLGKKIGKNNNDFFRSVISGPKWVQKHSHSNYGICKKAYDTYRNWRVRGYEYPPYIAYLALFVLAGYVEDGRHSQIAYYPKLRELIGEDDNLTGQYPYFDKMMYLWKDLERWSRKEKLEGLGRFRVRIRGSWKHVGIPLSQTILSERERKSLPLIFNEEGAISSDLLGPNEIVKMLITHGKKVLSKKTLRLLNGEEENESFLEALIDIVLEDLNNWDGTLPESDTSDYYVKSKVRLCLSIDKVRKVASFTLRINTHNDFPDSSLTFKRSNSSNNIYFCRSSIENWSTELTDSNHNTLNAAHFNWLEDVKLEDHINKYLAYLKGSPIRLFIEGKKVGLSSLIETTRIEKNSRYILVCTDKVKNEIKKWGTENSEYFRELDFGGIPDGWNIFRLDNPNKSCESFKELTFINQTQISLVGGVRSGRGNKFLSTFPPNLIIKNFQGTEKVYLNGKEIPFDKSLELWLLPANACQRENTLVIQNTIDGEKKIHFNLIKPSIAIKSCEAAWKRMEDTERSETTQILGNNVYNHNFLLPDTKPSLPTFLSKEIIFLGQKPGEIYHWEGKGKPKIEWKPIWAIYKIKKKKWGLYYCSEKSIVESRPSNTIVNKKKLRYWKTVLNNMKKAITKPTFPPIEELWNEYIEVANHV